MVLMTTGMLTLLYILITVLAVCAAVFFALWRNAVDDLRLEESRRKEP